jgi:ABC-2 type transport system ATP-binding protein
VEVLRPFAVGKEVVEEHTRSVLVPVTGGSAVLIDALRRLDSEQIAVADVGLRRPTLDDVFLALTGHSANADEPGPAETPTRPTEGAIR